MQIKKVPLFRSLPDREICVLAQIMKPLEVGAGSLLCREGNHGDTFYVILEGEVEIVKSLGGKNEQFLGRRGPGGYFGEMSLLIPDGKRTASVRSLTVAKFAVLSRGDFENLLQSYPILAYEMVRELSLRLRKSDDDTIRDLEAKNRQLEAMYRELKAAQAQIIEKEKLEHELSLARDIQKSILTHDLILFDDFNFGARMEPARSIGGDLYDFIPLDAHRVGLSIGDVSGKGIPAAMFMALYCSLLRVEAANYRSPTEVLRGVNRYLLSLSQARMFVTALYGILDRRTRTFTYARAGHEIPFLLNRDGEAVPLGWGQGQLLGFFEDLQLDEQEVTLPEGSTLILYTDGVFDALNSRGERFGLDRFMAATTGWFGISAQEMCDRLVQQLLDYQGENQQFDDITLMAISHAG